MAAPPLKTDMTPDPAEFARFRRWLAGITPADLPPAPLRLFLGRGHHGEPVHMTIRTPQKYLDYLNMWARKGPDSARARTGAQMADMRRLKALVDDRASTPVLVAADVDDDDPDEFAI